MLRELVTAAVIGIGLTLAFACFWCTWEVMTMPKDERRRRDGGVST